MTRKEFVSWATNDPVFLKLYEGWLTSGRDRKLVPSIDRIDSKKGYIAGNLMCDSRYLIGQTVSALLSPSDGFRPGNGRSSAMMATGRKRPLADVHEYHRCETLS